ncbi:UvrD/REP helicase [Jonesia denitrificans DSM 20603]|uniref:DNA 3'-5' helicase n=1 Tax=Jonesia denitrificans (strain ATCC 14870 / DSM 20603 / BCRC 15368 / CIP 55.134 / JCM 11481 / NBRC 15587 / NCTC 10816 / Prevot 55134) TaxID=471856 RepID=C7R1Q7_JONDD|nr:UvrD/REP helicase [Jonesia denitrificans DSM 20603]ASE07971.1 ATP-dependent helicase [Jonesia denitrificans]SQH20355.1 DNA-dependent helicase II [Jonesia denitrificans]
MGVDTPLDPSQRAFLDAYENTNNNLVLVGAPGSGKTHTMVELVRHAVHRGVSTERVLVLAATRHLASVLRTRITQVIDVPVRGAIARTAPALAYSLLSAHAAAQSQPLPRLITGPEQDHLLAQILAGHAQGLVPAPAWPPSVPPQTLSLRGFRDELRDLFMRVAEHGLTSGELFELGQRHERPDWCAAAQVLAEYDTVVELSSMQPDVGRRDDPARIVSSAADILSHWDTGGRPTYDLVIVDDAQEMTAATVALLQVLHRDGARIVMAGDPDMTVQGFRGASPRHLNQATFPRTAPGGFAAERLTLSTVWRSHPAVRERVREVTSAIASAGIVAHRRATSRHVNRAQDPQASPPDEKPTTVSRTQPGVEAHLAPSIHVETSAIVNTLRHWHIDEAIAWSSMAVIARSTAHLQRIRRALERAQVPVTVLGTDVALRDEPAVRGLLDVLALARDDTIDLDLVLRVLQGVYGGLDSLGIRQLRRHLRSAELRQDGARTSDELLIDLMATIRDHGHHDIPPHHVAAAAIGRLTAMIQAACTVMQGHTHDAQTALWAVWDAAQVAPTWRHIALSDSPASGRAHDDLDAVMALFRSAETHVDRMPDPSVESFIAFIEAQDLPADSLAIRNQSDHVVSLLTPQAAAGRQWQRVIITALQDGIWPNLTLRDSLLGSLHLVDILTGRASEDGGPRDSAARTDILHDELRSFALSLSRAQEHVMLTAVDDDEQSPSPFLHLAAPQPRPITLGDESGPLDMRSVTTAARAALHQALLREDAEQAHQLASLLAAMEPHTPASDPHTWYQAHPVSTTLPLFHELTTLPLSPSRVDVAQTCSLRWALETSGGQPASGLSQSVGTLIHDVAAHAPMGTITQFTQLLDERWDQLNLPPGWPAQRLRSQAQTMVGKLAQYTSMVRDDVVEVLVEHPFTVEIAGARISGSIDRVEILRSGDARIVDLKTGRTAPTQADTQVNPQLGIYQLAVLHGAVPGVEHTHGADLLYIATPTKKPTTRHQPPLTEPDNNWVTTLIEDTVTTMRSASMTAHRNRLCDQCPVRTSCPLHTDGRHLS